MASGDQFIASKEAKEKIVTNFHAFCAEMEGAAIAHAAYLNKVSCVIIRAISDKADNSAAVSYTHLKVEKISSTTLPIGVLQDIEIQTDTRVLSSGDYVIMVTDGVMDALPAGEQDTLMCAFIEGTDIVNPKELAQDVYKRQIQDKPNGFRTGFYQLSVNPILVA